MGKKKGTEVVETGTEDGAMILVQDQVPDYIKGTGAGRGNENVGVSDLVIPRLELIQGLSPAVKKGDPGFIKGAAPGMLCNSVSRKLYGDLAHVVPIYYTKDYLVWRDRKFGGGNEGGFFGAYPTQAEAQDRADQEGGEAKGIIVIDTPQHFCYLVNSNTGDLDEVMISLPRTKAKVSRQWNSMIRMLGGDRFSRVYALTTQMEKNAKGDFYNFSVAAAGYPSKKVYLQASEMHKKIHEGTRRVVMDTSGLDGGGTDAGDGSEM